MATLKATGLVDVPEPVTPPKSSRRYRLRVRHALEDPGPSDAFVSVSESAGDLTGRFMITRAKELAYDQGYEPTYSECLETPPAFEERFIPFRDGKLLLLRIRRRGGGGIERDEDDALATFEQPVLRGVAGGAFAS